MKRSVAIILSLLSATCGATIASHRTSSRPTASTPPARPAPPVPTTHADVAPAAATPKTTSATPPTLPPTPVVPESPRTPPSVRIILTKPTASGAAKVKVKGAWALVAADGATVRSGTGLDGDLGLGAHGASLLGASFPVDAELRPAVDGDLRIDARTYSGALRVERGASGKLQAEIATDVESYVAQVVNSEIPAAFPREAQRTQAILARSYALRSTARTSPDAPLVLADVGGIDQEFAGLAPVPEHRRVGADAAQSTRGLVLVDDGTPLLAYYHSTCGGTTCPGEVVFGKLGAATALKGGVACPWCTSSKYFQWNAKIAGADVAKAAGMTGALESFAVAEKTAGGRAASFDVKVGGRTKRVHAAEFRLRVGPSAMRSVFLDDATVVDGELVIHGRGWGHGVGLCQMGAKTLAEKGMTAEAIVAVYYPGAVVEKRW
jgi:stage II sporulation protein D